MRLPFHRKFDEIFRGERSTWLKAVCGVVVAAYITGSVFLRQEKRGDRASYWRVAIIGVVFAAVAGGLIAFMLQMKDRVKQKIAKGERVNPFARLSRLGHLVSFAVVSNDLFPGHCDHLFHRDRWEHPETLIERQLPATTSTQSAYRSTSPLPANDRDQRLTQRVRCKAARETGHLCPEFCIGSHLVMVYVV